MTHGSIGIAPLECINPKIDKWRLRWNILPVEGDEHMVTFEEKEFNRKPTLTEIKDTIHEWMNRQIDTQIVTGFIWRDIPVWLSTENQFNFKAAFDLAVQTGGAPLPVKFKISEDNYFIFETIEDLRDFYTSAMTYIQTTLNNGWAAKDEFDFTPYEQALTEKT